jgi:hypothetical protein
MSDNKSLFSVDVNIWRKPAENSEMLTNRGQEIFADASLR